VRLTTFVTGAGDESRTPVDAEQLSSPHSPQSKKPKNKVATNCDQ